MPRLAHPHVDERVHRRNVDNVFRGDHWGGFSEEGTPGLRVSILKVLLKSQSGGGRYDLDAVEFPTVLDDQGIESHDTPLTFP